MSERSNEFVAWLADQSAAVVRDEIWVPADEYQDAVDEALDWQTEAHADREFYDNDSYFYTGTGSTYFHGERG